MQFQVEVNTPHPSQTNLSVEDEINNFEKNWNWVLLLSMNNNKDNDLQIIIDVLYDWYDKADHLINSNSNHQTIAKILENGKAKMYKLITRKTKETFKPRLPKVKDYFPAR